MQCVIQLVWVISAISLERNVNIQLCSGMRVFTSLGIFGSYICLGSIVITDSFKSVYWFCRL